MSADEQFERDAAAGVMKHFLAGGDCYAMRPGEGMAKETPQRVAERRRATSTMARAHVLALAAEHLELAGWRFAICGPRTREPVKVYLEHPHPAAAREAVGWWRVFGDVRLDTFANMDADARALVAQAVAALAPVPTCPCCEAFPLLCEYHGAQNAGSYR